MKATGVTRQLDPLGRIVLPIELRRNLDIKTKDPVEIFVEDDIIIVQKYKPQNTCMLTGEVHPDNIVLSNGLVVSRKVASEILAELKEKL